MPISEAVMERAHEGGIKVEMVNNIPVWEALPVFQHQSASYRIQSSIRLIAGAGGKCACVHAADVSLRFPDGSQKRPDISIFCREPDERDSEITLMPEAVIEIISKGYEDKDLVIGVPFYKSQGIRDIVVFDPYTNAVTHHQPDGSTTEYVSPVTLQFTCGCECVV